MFGWGPQQTMPDVRGRHQPRRRLQQGRVFALRRRGPSVRTLTPFLRMHMLTTQRSCPHSCPQFCWVCLKPWSQRCGFYRCATQPADAAIVRQCAVTGRGSGYSARFRRASERMQLCALPSAYSLQVHDFCRNVGSVKRSAHRTTRRRRRRARQPPRPTSPRCGCNDPFDGQMCGADTVAG